MAATSAGVAKKVRASIVGSNINYLAVAEGFGPEIPAALSSC